MNPVTTKVAVLGAGAWGLALADYISRQGAEVAVWDRSEDVLVALRQTNTVNRPKGLIVDTRVQYCSTIPEVVQGARLVLSVVPSYATGDICRALAPLHWSSPALFVNCSKGIEQGSLHLPCEIFEQMLGSHPDLNYAVLAGPSHAEEVSRHVPTAVVAAADNTSDADFIQTLLTSPTFRVYTQSDVKGVELGGALKNVIAIAAGVCDGKGYGDNTKAALITRGVAEMARLAQAMGAMAETIAGLSGLGDLIVTAMSRHSRNRSFGELIASGCGPDAALEKIGAVVEGYKTTKSAYELSVKHGVEMPLVTAVYRVLYGGLDINECISLLLDRGAKMEKLKE